MHVAILGRQPALSMAELESYFGSKAVQWFSSFSATIDTETLEIEQLGGTVKAGRITDQLQGGDWLKVSQHVISSYVNAWSNHEGKITLGISAYGFDISEREVQKLGIIMKQRLKKHNVSLRVIPNTETYLNTATSHHNKLGLSANKVELLIIRNDSGRIIVAESTGTQNITALARRDQGRPKRDAFVGMLPPKLAQIMIHLARRKPGTNGTAQVRLLDPFCGTGVILQEASLLGYDVYGTDLSEKMIRYTTENLQWLEEHYRVRSATELHEGDAMTTKWQSPIDLVVAEAYLGQPFSAPPSPAKLQEVRGNVNNIVSKFLLNLHAQLSPGTPLCVAVPAWRDAAGTITYLPLANSLSDLGYALTPFTLVRPSDLVYYREDQIVARQLLVMTRT